MDTHVEKHNSPWRRELEIAFEKNGASQIFYPSLATIKRFGRPANRVVRFYGFLSEPVHSETPPVSDSEEFVNIKNSQADVLVFGIDARSGMIEDVLHGSRFAEVAWFFPDTKEQWRVSGTLSLVIDPEHVLARVHLIPPPLTSPINVDATHTTKTGNPHSPPLFASPPSPKDSRKSGSEEPAGNSAHAHISSPHVDWEAKRLALWRTLSPMNREQYARSYPLKDPLAVQKDSAVNLQPDERETTTGDAIPENVLQQKEALRNFALLLLEVDGADHVKMDSLPIARTKYRRSDCAFVLEGHPESGIPQDIKPELEKCQETDAPKSVTSYADQRYQHVRQTHGHTQHLPHQGHHEKHHGPFSQAFHWSIKSAGRRPSAEAM